jgi:MFS family permease
VRRELLSTHAAFAAFGVFWGAWAALLPAVQRQTGASKSELGLALLCVALGALPAMLATGALLDRLGRSLVAPLLALFAASIVAPGFATSVGGLALALAGVGVASGALDVAVNARASALERASGRRLMAVAHALYSAGVVVGSVATGLARQAGSGPRGVVLVVCGVLLLTAAFNLGGGAIEPTATPRPRRRLNLARPLVALGALCGVAFVVESGGEQWSALYLETRLHGDPSVGGLGPAAFAGAMVAGRLTGGVLERRLGERRLLVTGAGLATVGLLAAALAPSFGVALVGFGLTGVGISVAAPTLFGAAGRRSSPDDRGSAMAAVTTVSYLGFVVGPPLIGGVSGAFGLRVGMLALAVVAALYGLGAASSTALGPRGS